MVYMEEEEMRSNYLADVLVDLVDEEHHLLALQIDKYLQKQWENAPEEFKIYLDEFQKTPNNNPSGEFALYIILTEEMIHELRRQEEGDEI
jgi:hypothetical protein